MARILRSSPASAAIAFPVIIVVSRTDAGDTARK
jgi:hypothetical protein